MVGSRWAVLLLVSISIFNVFVGSSTADEYRTVRTLNGEIRGKRNVTLYDEKPFYSYRGIPYAQPPVGELRFKAPAPITTWTNVRDAFDHGSACLQRTYMTKQLIGTEDCLFLNVYVPENPSNEKLPVMFFIHGGGFNIGSSNGYGPDFLINNDVILVTFNYRLNIFGFSSFGTPEYSGNMGLKDQWLALKWVNDNIEFFGGDKSKITIFGESAGSSSVNFHVISPKSRGLFQRAILQSGSVLNPWSIHYDEDHLQIVETFAKNEANIGKGNKDKLIQYLKNVDANLLAEGVIKELYIPGTGRKEFVFKWVPMVEASNAVDPFLSEMPEDILQRSSVTDIDALFGFNSAEAITLVPVDVVNPDSLAPFDKEFEIQLPKNHLKLNYDSKDYKRIAKDIRKFYFPKNAAVGKDTINEYISLISDAWMNYGIIDAARLQQKYSTGRTYLYQMTIDSGFGFQTLLFGSKLTPGTAHGDDIFYMFRIDDSLFGEPYKDIQKDLAVDTQARKSINFVSKLWTDFAKYGSPTLPTDSVDFKPIESGVFNYADITNDGLVPGVNPLYANVKFWDSLYRKYQKVFLNSAGAKDEL